ncbi:SDR family NAD(P)-dependent oxidoreductase [Streptomyces sp. NPDC006996]|uniref:SDR family NAD(P)-dependent oxidoreductase n=1 Tax=Streptomyces sp. NPDC006996 TaxID=3156908 RepID=UPI0033F3AD58
MTDESKAISTADISPTDIAIVGMACRLPGANDPEAFWQRIMEGREMLTRLTDEELRDAGVPAEVFRDPSFVRVTSLIDGYGELDTDFFGITPSEARLMDPQHRLFLELCWRALEDVGCDPGAYDGEIGVFAGGGRHSYLRYVEPSLDEIDELDGSIRGLQAEVGSYGDFMATRTSFRLGLTGPSLNVATACSTALVAVHLACQSLVLGEADLALAGAVNLHNPQMNGYMFEEGSICSPDGQLRPFDARANGSVFGNGGGVVALKRLADALEANDRIVAVIKATAINNDGADKMSFTAPAVTGQAEVIRRAHRMAGIDPRNIGFIETHGTGTALGDPIEIAALTQAFGDSVEAGRCALGALKSQIGHLGPAAGIASLIKAALVVERGRIPLCVNHETPNPNIAFEESPFYVPRESAAWSGPRHAGVSAFGVGGTNAHAVLAQAPVAEQAPPAPLDRPVALVLSARTPSALEAMRGELAEHLSSARDRDLGAAARVLTTGRHPMRHRGAVAAQSIEQAVERLRGADWSPLPPAPDHDVRVVFAFPGQGSQFVGAGRALYQTDRIYREVVDECSEWLLNQTGLDIRPVLMPGPDAPEGEAEHLLRQALYAQPAIFISEYGLARSLMATGVIPDVLIGHSIGEYAAACLAGVFTQTDALLLAAERGRLMHVGTEPGAMMAVGLGLDDLEQILPSDLDVAALNAPDQTVVAGPVAAIAQFDDQLQETDILHKVLGTSLAAHSSLMAPIVDEFRAAARSVTYRPATMRIASTLYGSWAAPDTMTDPEYWVNHLRRRVQFMPSARAVLSEGPAVLVEVGPGRGLAGMFRQLDGGLDIPAITPWVAGEPEPESAAELAGQVWSRSGRVDWARHLEGVSRRRTTVPGYAFERSSYWADPPGEGKPASAWATPRLSRVDSWLQDPYWERAPVKSDADGKRTDRRVLVLAPGWDPSELAWFEGAAVCTDSDRVGTVADAQHELERLRGIDEAFDTLVYLAPATPPPGQQGSRDLHGAADRIMRDGFWPLLHTARVVSGSTRADVDLLMVTTGRHPGQDSTAMRPELALLTGPAKVLPQEYPNLRVAEVDVEPGSGAGLAAVVAAELAAFRPGACITYRTGQRRLLHHAPRPWSATTSAWKQGGSYVITGGLGGIGLAVAEDAARTAGVRLTLVGRTAAPTTKEAARLLADPSTPAETRHRLVSLERLRASGARLAFVVADVTDADALAALRAEHGPFTGIVHAAGVPSGRLVDNLEQEHVRRVLAPKVRGTVLLSDLVADEATEWMALCSSMSSVVGGVGHVDYCSANAFLDAFAQARSALGRRTLSLSYDTWTEVGMAVKKAEAAEAMKKPHGAAPGTNTVMLKHPLFAERLTRNGRVEFHGEFRAATDWLVDEHRVAGRPVVPGTGTIEILRSAAEMVFGPGALEISELDLLRPFVVGEKSPTRFAVGIDGALDSASATLVGLEDGAELEYATAKLRLLTGDEVRHERRAALAPLGPDAAVPPPPGSGLTAFGPRWDNVKRAVPVAADEIVVEGELPDEFIADVERFGLHPALLDTAAGALIAYGDGGAYLPISYERILVLRRMPTRIRAHVRRRASIAPGSIVFDVTVQDMDGNAIVEIHGYGLRAADPARPPANLTAEQTRGNRVLVSSECGDLAELRFADADRRPPGPGEVELRVLAAGLNFKEVLIATGLLDPPVDDYRYGLECAGVVSAVGEGVTGLRIGEPVMAVGTACLAEYAVVRAELTHRIPSALTFKQAAGIPVAFTTAQDCLTGIAALRAGERVLIHAVTGGVGQAATQLAVRAGAEVFGTAGTASKREYAQEYGIARVMDSRSTDFERECLKAGGVDVVLNSLSGEFISAGLRCLRPRGRFVELGRRDIVDGSLLDMGLLSSGLTFGSYYPDPESPEFVGALREVARLAEAGEISPLHLHVFERGDVAEAFAFMSRAQHIGKVVVSMAADSARTAGDIDGAVAPQETLTPEAGVAALLRGIAAGVPRVLVTRRDLGAQDDELVVATHVLQGTDTSAAHTRPELDYGYVPPEGEIEQGLGQIWATLLSIDRVGAQDTFLDLGGDSLYATQMVARLRRRFGVRIAPATVLGDVTLRDLARQVEQMLDPAEDK